MRLEQKEIYDFRRTTKLERFNNRICYNQDKFFRTKKCSQCGTHFEYDKKGNPIRYLLTCNSPYCKDEECFKKRYMIAKKYFEVFFNAYPVWRTKRGSRWIHEVLGFSRVDVIDKPFIQKCKRQVYNFLRALEKKFNVKIKGVGVRDLAYDVINKDGKFYLHFHFARRPYHNEDLEIINQVGFKYGLKYSKIGFRKKSSLINYFSKRHAGYFGHKKNDSSWGFADIFSPEEYLETFCGERKTFSSGFSRKEIRLLKDRYIQLRTRLEEALSSKEQYTAPINYCPKCGCTEYSWSFEGDIHDPPPDLIKTYPDLVVEYIKI